ncbi:MAG: GNAT family N-acetyltransferase [Dermatophilaceae bacterium]
MNERARHPQVALVGVSGHDTSAKGSNRFDAWAAVFVEAAREVLGDDHDERDVDEVRAMESSTARERHRVAAVGGGVVAGAAELVLPRLDNLDLAELRVAVLPSRRRRGVGTLLLGWAEEMAVTHGRQILQTMTSAPSAALDRSAAFARRHRFAVAQESLRSDLTLPVDAAQLAAPHGDEYVVESAVDGIPRSWLDDRAELARRMSTDMPVGELALEEESWDADRLRAEVRMTLEMGRHVVDTVARHVPTGRLVGFTHVELPTSSDTVYQHDTLVTREHRGHGLGLRLKAASTSTAQREWAHARRIRTWNAVENTPMLDVNRALGYRTTARLTSWQKRLG